jgi:V-type H+-transporting ATPase subunit C
LSNVFDDFNIIQNVVRKVERQYLEIAGKEPQPLQIQSSRVEEYLRNFVWDFARYQHAGRQLGELVSQVQSMAAKVDDELKKLSAMLVEKNLTLSNLQRRKTINLQTSDFEDFLTAESVARLEILRADGEKILETIMVVVPNAVENEFLKTYESVGASIVEYRAGESPHSAIEKGSPVVPGSAKKIFEEGDNSMYSVVMIKYHYTSGHYEEDTFVPGTTINFLEPLKAAFREKRCVVREFSYDGNRGAGLDVQIEEAKEQASQALSTIVRWCQVHYGEVYGGWIHLKVIRGFVESVLRYGLPVNFLSVFVEPASGRDKQVKASLVTTIAQLRPELGKKAADEEEDEDDTENLPFVCQKFNVIGASSS